MPFHVFFAVFLLGQIAGLVAQVPAVLGAFEAVMLWGLTPALTTASVLIGLVAYRVVYFLLPLAGATAIWVVREARRWYWSPPRRHAAASLRLSARSPCHPLHQIRTRSAGAR